MKEKDKRLHVESPLMMDSLVRKETLRRTHRIREYRLIPDANVIKIGGLSIIDRGKEVLMPVVEEIGELGKRHKIIVVVGGGTRERHTYAIGMDLGIPVGGLAMLAGAIAEQNALILYCLLARYGGIRIAKDEFEKLPLYLESGFIPVVVGTPPYHYWEHLPEIGKLPPHGTDTGAYLLAESLGVKRCIFVKDVDGLYPEIPTSEKKMKIIKKISAQEALEMDLEDYPVERKVLEVMLNARNVKKIYIVNGLKRGNIKKVFEGRSVGTVIYT